MLEYDCEEETEYEPWCPYEYYGPQRQRSVLGLKGENEFEREAWCPYKN